MKMRKSAGKFASTIAVAVVLASTGAGFAQSADANQPDIERGKTVYERVGICLQCHGWDGNGRGKNPRSPGKAALLRETELDTQSLKEVIQCGIPGTPMPYHDRLAYRDDRCYGLVLDDFEEGEAPAKGKTFREADMDNLVAYIEAKIKGAGETTLAQCEEFYGRADHPSCRGLE